MRLKQALWLVMLFWLWNAAAQGQDPEAQNLLKPWDDQKEHGFWVSLDLFFGSTANSSTQVGELDREGTRLKMRRDLGLDWVSQPRLEGGYRFNRDNNLSATLGYIILRGSTTLDEDVNYDGATLQGGTKLESEPDWYTVGLKYERVLVRWGDGDRGQWAADLGLHYDYVHWTFSKATFAPNSIGHEKEEDFEAQTMPIPVIGMSLRQPLTSRLDLELSARGFRANHWDSFRKEGGTVYFSESLVEAGAGLKYRLSKRWTLSGGPRYMLLDIREKSHEDDNKLKLSTFGGYLNAAYSF